ncbi:MAG: DUF6444 domain-containing protein [Methylococcaceae bacterium]|nr:DUF6444 domain-containing protein [Methylococcaceae bacterium]
MSDLKCPTQQELDHMSHAEKDALIRVLFARLEALESRLKELEGKVEKTRRNSSKPPSSEGLKRQAAQPRKAGSKPICVNFVSNHINLL